jgi:hypothetical protein
MIQSRVARITIESENSLFSRILFGELVFGHEREQLQTGELKNPENDPFGFDLQWNT